MGSETAWQPTWEIQETSCSDTACESCEIIGIHCYFHTTLTGETNSRHFENLAGVL